MLRITVNKSASAAKKYYSEKYYSEGQLRQDYYSEKDNVIGMWGGKAADKLGLKGDIDKEDFASLCDNLIPGNDKSLTERTNLERRVGYDFTFNASKSLSLAYTFGSEGEKKEILDAFRESVNLTMSEIESGMQTRVREKYQNTNRETGNIAYGEFIHFTSRPVENLVDPHLHAHCFVFNTTYDEVEQKWKAGQFGQLKKDAPYYEAIFHSVLADKLQGLGYEIEKTKNSFEIKGVHRDTVTKFSRRTEEIERIADEKNISNLEDKAKLGAKTREGKRKEINEADQISEWNQRLTENEKSIFAALKNGRTGEKKNTNELANDSVEYSLNHYLERKSVSTDKEILTLAIRNSLGKSDFEKIKYAFSKKQDVISVKENGETFITTKGALKEENELIEKARNTKGKFKALNENYTPLTNLSEEQQSAVQHALNSTDGITIIAGKAGTGKTTLMKEVRNGIVAAGKQIHAFAPSAEASRNVQRKEGFESAETIATLLVNKTMQAEIRNSVLWIDEAGLISNKDMNKILDVAKQYNARLILTGDTRQHNSVERGDALRTLQEEAGIMPIQVSKIQRQKNQQYKEAISFLSKAEIEKGFNKLDKMGAIHEIDDHTERLTMIADDYFVSSYGKNRSHPEREVLVVSPTHSEAEKVTQKIREKLKKENILNDQERPFHTLKNIQLTLAERQKSDNYHKDTWVIFHQNTKGFKAGAKYRVLDNTNDKVMLSDHNGKVSFLPMENAAKFNVFESKMISLNKGDKLRITGNGKSNDGKHLFNGTLYKVNGFDRSGNIKLSNGSTLSKDFGHFDLGYVLTSHASQGKTVDKVIISQSTMSFRASSKEQFYVSVSRGRQAVSIYTDDKEDLLHAVSQSNQRMSALELIKKRQQANNVVEINRRNILLKIKERALSTIENAKQKINNGLQRKDQTKDRTKSR